MDVNQRERIKTFCNNFISPAAILDSSLKCVYSNRPNLIPNGTSLLSYVNSEFKLPITEMVQTMVIINGNCFCARIIPFEEGLFICEFVDTALLLEIAGSTDIYQKALPIINSVEHNVSNLWRSCFSVRDRLESENQYELLEQFSAFEQHIARLSSVVKNSFEYTNMLFSNKNPQKLDTIALVGGIVSRCNTILSKCERCIKFMYDPVDLYIYADSRHAINAIINSIQNALLYSPFDCVPTATLCKLVEGDKKYVVFKIMNDSVYFVDKDFGENLDVNFDFQRIGYGIPIIKRFASEAGGSFFMNENNGTVSVGVKIPAVDMSRETTCRVESSEFVFYDTGIPDIIEVKMREVVDFFVKG